MDNAKFWDDRYRSFPQLGSGPGSRGYAASYKNRLVKAIIKHFGISSIVDIGCGDLCWLDPEIVASCSYMGLDISAVAIERAKALYPALPFAVYDVTAQPVNIRGDLVISFDVLIHQTEPHLFCVALGNILAAISRIGLVSYMTPPLSDGRFPPRASFDAASGSSAELEREFCQMAEGLPDHLPRAQTAFHEPLPRAVATLRKDLDVSVAGCYRHQTVYAIRAHSDGTTR